MGLEALSRGAASATFVEQDRHATETIAMNLEKLRLTGATVVRDDAIRRLAADGATGRRYDLVLIDPPYRMLASLLPSLAAYLPAVVAPDGLVVVESDEREEPELPLPKRTSRRYGSARITIFQGS
jgi:16S rRNA (guanine966-N2)-methyltransferase